jgi:SNF2 family DNA or RNA helicase
MYYFSSLEARRTKALHQYVKEFKPKQLVLMSGTPIRNRVTEIYSALLLMDYQNNSGLKRKFGSQWAFNNAFSNVVIKRFGPRQVTTWEGQKNVEELKALLEGKWIKFTLEELVDLPEIVFDEVVSTTAETRETKRLDTELDEGWMSIELGAPPASHISTLKAENALLKVPFCIELVKGLQETDKTPLLIFTDHRKSCEALHEAFEGSEMIRGDTPMNVRDTIVRKFQLGKIPVLVGTIGAMGTGLTLTAASTLIFLDKSWEPYKNKQAYHRIYRATQKKRCRVVEIVRKGIDQRINRMLREKEALIKTVGM